MVTAIDSDRMLADVDPEIAELIGAEAERQAEKIRLIPSENYVSKAVLEATASVLTNKYSEGYPGRRYYEGQQIIDQVETIAIERAKALFGVEHVNVQPYSGSPANLAVYFAFLQPGDTIMGMALPMGGHLTHGAAPTLSGKWLRPVQYGVRKDTGRVDMDEVRDLALQEKPKIIVCGGTAIPRVIDFAGFASIAEEVGAMLLADIAHIAGLVVGEAHPTPVGHATIITTTTHKTLRGPRGAMILSSTAGARQEDRLGDPSRTPRRSAQPHDGGDRRRAEGSGSARVQDVRTRHRREREGPSDRARPTGVRPGVRRDGQPLDPHRPHQQRHPRQAGREGSRSCRPRTELQRRPLRSVQARESFGTADRYTLRHQPRHETR